ncbi:hypothetical protein JCM8208_004077 [Rhodotorula glutinis]
MPYEDSDDEGGALPKNQRPVVRERDTRPRNVVASHEDPFFQANMPPHLKEKLDKARSRRDEDARYVEAMSPHWEEQARGRRGDATVRRRLATDQPHEQGMLNDLEYLDPARRSSHEGRASFASDGSGALPASMRPRIRKPHEPRPDSALLGGDDEPQIRQPAPPPIPSSSRAQPAPTSPSKMRKKSFGNLFHRRKKSGPSGDAHSLAKGGARTYRAGEVGVASDSDSDY